MLASQYASDNGKLVAVAQTKTSNMILTQPVSQHLEKLTMPVTLMIGMLDTTAFGKGQAPVEVRDRLRPISALAEEAGPRTRRSKRRRLPYGGDRLRCVEWLRPKDCQCWPSMAAYQPLYAIPARKVSGREPTNRQCRPIPRRRRRACRDYHGMPRAYIPRLVSSWTRSLPSA